eukprot:1708532-Amphidinium_carterae.1
MQQFQYVLRDKLTTAHHHMTMFAHLPFICGRQFSDAMNAAKVPDAPQNNEMPKVSSIVGT